MCLHLRLNGVGLNSSWIFVMEFFGRRQFRTDKGVGASVRMA